MKINQHHSLPKVYLTMRILKMMIYLIFFYDNLIQHQQLILVNLLNTLLQQQYIIKLLNKWSKPQKSRRSITAGRNPNRKRNRIERLQRDRHMILHSVYHRFTICQMKHILYQCYVHLTVNINHQKYYKL